MKNPNIAKTLKYYRKKNKLSVADVAQKLDEVSSMPVAIKTIYGWESGQTQPDADMLLLLCQLYQINDILKTFGYKNEEEFHITEFEKKLIMQYRRKTGLQSIINEVLELNAENPE